jgi:hypothetical protein
MQTVSWEEDYLHSFVEGVVRKESVDSIGDNYRGSRICQK